MALLTLQDIGKIYVSEGNATVGIRGVNVSFSRGEFVAITGKSGSGKSTLLNVISGMDSYEEGELFIEGEATSHYLQPDWETYREKYISFIFQDYNIIDSFTVLQNVELALMHIEDRAERRARATELIRRVGLASHMHHKGSRLSGGQKQRTVIARALAKDSPIILADEPTGNLDAATSREILALLKEVSRDKLTIVVTHDFEELSALATRHIRIFDGAVESDTVLCAADLSDEATKTIVGESESKRAEALRSLKNGAALGGAIFKARPRLSLFLCLLMIIGTLGIFLSTSLCGGAASLFAPQYMFNHIEGRLVLAKQSGEVITDEELKGLATKHGAESYLHFDSLLDLGDSYLLTLPTGENEYDFSYLTANTLYGKDYGKDGIVGRYPEAANEVFLYLPIAYRDAVGKDALKISHVQLGMTSYRLVGVKYYVDNNLPAECLFTEQGFRTATALHFLIESANYSVHVTVKDESGATLLPMTLYTVEPSYAMPADKIYVDAKSYQTIVSSAAASGKALQTSVTFTANYIKYDYSFGSASHYYTFTETFDTSSVTHEKPESDPLSTMTVDRLIVSDELLLSIAEGVLKGSYRQASLFFESDEAAHAAAEALQKAGYLAIPSDTTYEQGGEEAILSVISSIVLILGWVLSILFLSFFINLCSQRAIGATKGDMAIMRSMGIPVRVIRIGVYFRMLISLIPAFICVLLSAVLIFTTPRFNALFTYLYPWQYALIFLGMLLLTLKTTHTQIRRLFGESVKKSLRGGASE